MLGAVTSFGYPSYLLPYAYASAVQRTAGRGMVRSASIPAAQPEQPVEPVRPVRQIPEVSSDTPLDHAGLLRRLETDPAAAAVRSRIQYVGNGREDGAASAAAYGPQAELPGTRAAREAGVKLPGSPDADPAGRDEKVSGGEEAKEPYDTKSAREVAEEAECQTCKERKYQDGSDDPGVSFKTAAHIAPEQAQSVVRGHEMEHVVRERAKAEREDRRVVGQSVTSQTAICPECGRVYVSGGTTRTVTMADPEAPQADAGEKNGAGKGEAA